MNISCIGYIQIKLQVTAKDQYHYVKIYAIPIFLMCKIFWLRAVGESLLISVAGEGAAAGGVQAAAGGRRGGGSAAVPLRPAGRRRSRHPLLRQPARAAD